MIGKSEGKGQLARPRHRWEGTKQDMSSSAPIQGPVASFCKYGNKPSGYIKLWGFLE
jgi:hypothetical protein